MRAHVIPAPQARGSSLAQDAPPAQLSGDPLSQLLTHGPESWTSPNGLRSALQVLLTMTVGGFAISRLGQIPSPGQEVEIVEGHVTLRAIRITEKRIDSFLLILKEAEPS